MQLLLYITLLITFFYNNKFINLSSWSKYYNFLFFKCYFIKKEIELYLILENIKKTLLNKLNIFFYLCKCLLKSLEEAHGNISFTICNFILYSLKHSRFCRRNFLCKCDLVSFITTRAWNGQIKPGNSFASLIQRTEWNTEYK